MPVIWVILAGGDYAAGDWFPEARILECHPRRAGFSGITDDRQSLNLPDSEKIALRGILSLRSA